MKKLDISKSTHTTINTKAPSCADNDGHFFQNQNLRQHGQQQLKRQVRRRITKKSYQERLMNIMQEGDCHCLEILQDNHENGK